MQLNQKILTMSQGKSRLRNERSRKILTAYGKEFWQFVESKIRLLLKRQKLLSLTLYVYLPFIL